MISSVGSLILKTILLELVRSQRVDSPKVSAAARVLPSHPSQSTGRPRGRRRPSAYKRPPFQLFGYPWRQKKYKIK